MAVLKEYMCLAHHQFEAYAPICQFCGHGFFVKQEIRTAPAFRRKNMKFIDGTLRSIADDHGLTDLKNDVKGGVSVLQSMTKTNDVKNARWVGMEHAQPGFSLTPGAKVPTVNAQSFGCEPTPAANIKLPPVTPNIVAGWNGK